MTHSTAPHAVQHTYTMHCATARCVSFTHSFIIIHSAASLNARARTSEARVTPHGCTQERLFSSVEVSLPPHPSPVVPPFVVLLVTLSMTTHGAQSTFPSVPNVGRDVFWERAGRFLTASVGVGSTCCWFGRSEYPRGAPEEYAGELGRALDLSLGGGIPLASSGATSCGTSSSTYGHGVAVCAYL